MRKLRLPVRGWEEKEREPLAQNENEEQKEARTSIAQLMLHEHFLVYIKCEVPYESVDRGSDYWFSKQGNLMVVF